MRCAAIRSRSASTSRTSCAVLLAREVEVLVAAQQVAERLDGEQHLVHVQLAALVDVDEPPLQHRVPLGEVVLGEDQLGGVAVELGGEAADLPVDLVDDAMGAFALALEVAELVLHVLDLALQSLLLDLEPVPLGPDLFEPAAGGLDGVALGVKRGWRSGQRAAGRSRRGAAPGPGSRVLPHVLPPEIPSPFT